MSIPAPWHSSLSQVMPSGSLPTGTVVCFHTLISVPPAVLGTVAHVPQWQSPIEESERHSEWTLGMQTTVLSRVLRSVAGASDKVTDPEAP